MINLVDISAAHRGAAEIRVTIHYGEFAVYAHFLNGEICYIGAGSLARPFAGGRNSKWLEMVKSNGGKYEVAILGWFATPELARANEREMIKRYKPKGNIFIPQKNRSVFSGSLSKYAAKCDPIGMSAEIRHRREAAGLSWRQLADLCGVADGTAQAWGNGRSRPSAGKLKIMDEIFGHKMDK